MYKLIFKFLFFLSFFTSAAKIQADSDESYTLSKIVVRESILAEVISLSKNSSDPPEAILAKTPFVYVTTSGLSGGITQTLLRGLDSRYSFISLDGLRLNDPQSPQRFFDASGFQFWGMEEFLIQSGSQAARYGGEAFAGVMTLKARRGERERDKEKTQRWSLSAGSFGTRSVKGLTDWGVQNHRGSLAVSSQYQKGLSRLNKKRFGRNQEQDKFENIQISQMSHHKWGKVHTEFSLLWGETESDEDQFGQDRSDLSSRQQKKLVSQKSSFQSGGWQYKWLTAWTDQARRFYQPNVDYVTRGQWSQNRVEMERSLFLFEKELDFQTYINHEIERGEFENFHKKNALTAFGLSTHFNWLQNVEQDFATRVEKWESRPAHFLYDLRLTASSDHLGSWFFKHSKANKSPSLYQLFAPALSGFPIGNRELKDEQLLSFESGWTLSNFLSVSVFSQTIERPLDYSVVSGYDNFKSFEIEGVEWSHSWGWHTASLGEWSYRYHATWLNYESQGSLPLRRPHAFHQFEIQNQQGAWGTTLNGRWVSSRIDQNPAGERVQLHSYEVWNLKFSYTPKKQQDEFSIQFINLFDREYEDLYGYTVLPRSFVIGYSAIH